MVEKRNLTARRHRWGTARRLRLETLLIWPREIGLGRARIRRDHPRVEGPRRRLVSPLFGEQTQLVQRRRSARRGRVGLHDLIVHRRRGIGCTLFEAFADIEEGVRRTLMRREDPQQLPEAQPGGRETATAVLLQ